MLEQIQHFLSYLLACAPALVGFGLVMLANLKRDRRHLQIFLPVLALVYVIVVLYHEGSVVDLTLSLMSALPSAVSGFINRWVGGWSDVPVAIVLTNLLVMVGFALVKLIYRALAKALTGVIETIFDSHIAKAYVRPTSMGHLELAADHVGIRTTAKVLMWLVVAVAMIAYAIVGHTLGAGVVSSFLPGLAMLVMGEIASYLGGLTGEELAGSLDAEDEDATRISGYSDVREALLHYFGDRHLTTATHERRVERPATHAEYCADLERSEAHEEVEAGRYFGSLVARGVLGSEKGCAFGELDHDWADESVRLLKGQSVLFASPFVHDFIPYLFLPVCANLMRGRKVVFLYGAENSEEGVTALVREGIAFASDIEDLWDCARLTADGSANPGVGLVSIDLLSDIAAMEANQAFFAQTSLVVVINASSILASYQLGLGILAELLLEGGEPAYCAFEVNNDGLVDSLSHALRTNLVEVSATGPAARLATGMLWDVDGDPLQQRIMPGVAQYLGVGSEIGAVALSRQVGHVTWVGTTTAPVSDVRWILGQYHDELFSFAEMPGDQAELDRRFDFVSDAGSLGRTDSRFMIVEDESNNMFEALRQYATRATSEAFVNVLAPDYLLKGYMADNPTILAADPKALPAIAPDYSKSPRNAIYSIVATMLQSDRMMSEAEVCARLRYAGVPVDEPQDALAKLIVENFPTAGFEGQAPEDCLRFEASDEYDPMMRGMHTVYSYGLTESARFQEPFRDLRVVPLLTERPDGVEEILGFRVFGMVCQSWLPGQFVTIGGKYYEIQRVSLEAGVLLRRASDHFSGRHYYRQLRRYTLGWGTGEVGPTRRLGKVEACVRSARLRVETRGYLDLDAYGDVHGAQRVEVPGVPERTYENKDVLVLRLDGADAEVVRTVAVTLSEVLATLYPKDHQYLGVLAAAAGRLAPDILPELAGEMAADTIVVVEDSMVDMGLLTSIDRNIKRILEIVYEYLDWNEEAVRRYNAGRSVGDSDVAGEEDFGFDSDPNAPGAFGGLGNAGADDVDAADSPDGAGDGADSAGADSAGDEADGEGAGNKKPGFFGRLRDRIGSLFGRKGGES